jgi:nucleoside-diphosphate-sugar epimerase
MIDNQIHAVTGAYGYSGRYIAQRLLAAGKAVQNTKILFDAAARAGVERIIHISRSN